MTNYSYPSGVITLNELAGQQRVRKKTAVVEQQKERNGIALGEGTHRGFELEKQLTTLVAAPGSVIETNVRITGTVIISGAILICDGNTPAITVADGATCIIKDSHISKEAGVQSAATDSYIFVEDGGNAVVMGCVFHGAQTSGYVVYNQSVHHNHVDVTGCANLTGQGHRHVTVVSEVP